MVLNEEPQETLVERLEGVQGIKLKKFGFRLQLSNRVAAHWWLISSAPYEPMPEWVQKELDDEAKELAETADK